MTQLSRKLEAQSPFAIVRQALAFIKSPYALRPHPEEPLVDVFGEGPGQAPREPLSAQLKPLLVLLALNLAVLFTLLPLLELWNSSVGIETPKLVLDKQSPLLVLAVIVLLPPLEEIIFRGWQTGKPWQLFTLLAVIVTLVAAGLASANGLHVLALPLLGLGVVGLGAGIWKLRSRSAAPRWFTQHFRWIFWIAAAVFAAAHYTNYQGVSLAHAPLVLPQLWAGLLLGFVRLRFGLTRSMALHVSSNALVVGISALTGLAGA